MRKVPNRSDGLAPSTSRREGESPFAVGQKVMLMGFDGQIDRVVTIVAVLPNVPQCHVRDQNGKYATVAESRLRCE